MCPVPQRAMACVCRIILPYAILVGNECCWECPEQCTYQYWSDVCDCREPVECECGSIHRAGLLASGVSCSPGTVCCGNGSCQAQSSCPQARSSAYGWKFSTDILPTLPRVVERSSCGPAEGTQSPSPFKESINAWSNADVVVEFSVAMSPASFVGAVIVENCGTGAAAVCPSPAGSDATKLVAMQNSASPLTPTFTTLSSGGTKYTATPVNQFAVGTWYRVTLRSNAQAATGIKATSPARFLDGDNDNREGGDYSYKFKTALTTCAIASVIVQPNPGLITQQNVASSPFAASALAANCNSISCLAQGTNPPSYSVDWTLPLSDNTRATIPILRLPTPATNLCAVPVTALQDRAMHPPASCPSVTLRATARQSSLSLTAG